MNISWKDNELIKNDILKSINIFNDKLGHQSEFFRIRSVNIALSLKDNPRARL